ncbi:MAG: rod shape-determining protein MreC [Fimbriimonadaceae bacterium]|nr:rod shape-determining protein MreC [Chitinophagales bacterium]
MRSFFLFIIRNYAIILFLILELLSFWLIFNNNAYHKTFFLNSANYLTGNVNEKYSSLTDYLNLGEINDSLLAENAGLRSQIHQSRQFDTVNVYQMQDSTGTVLYTYIPAEVISNSFTEVNNYITLNRGTKHGIKKDMGVITSSGICGKIITATENYSVAMSVLHGNFFTRAAIKKTNVQGNIRWEIGDPTIVTMVDVSEPGELQPGDTIITTANSLLFPRGILIGTLQEYGREEGSNFYTLKIKLATQFSRLHTVYVVNYLRKEEQKSAEEAAINNAGN